MNTESGEEVSSTSFDNAQPQTDANYITQEEWDELEKQNQDLIEKFEDSQTNGGGGGGITNGQFIILNRADNCGCRRDRRCGLPTRQITHFCFS